MSEERPPFGVFATDARLVIQTWDPWLTNVTGIPPAAALGRPLTDLIPGVAERGLLPTFHSVLTRGTVEVLSAALHRFLFPCSPSERVPGFDHMHQNVTIGPIREDSRITGVIVTIEDVTPRVARDRAVIEALRADRDDAVPDSRELTRLLAQDDWRSRRTAVSALAQHGNAIVESLVETLRAQHLNLSVLSSAIDLLAMSDIDVVEPLITLLDNPDANLRIQAALMLGVRRDARAVEPLLAKLADADVNVQFHVIEALGQLGATAACESLVAVAERGDFFLAFPAVQALTRIGGPGIAPRLVPLLGDDMLRAPVVDALGELGDEDVTVPLVHLLNTSNAPPDIVADALAGLYARYETTYGAGEHIASIARREITASGTQRILDAVQRVESERLQGLATVLGWLDGPAVQRALTRLLGQEGVRAQVVEALVRHGGGVVSLLSEQLRAEDLETRQAAAVALGRIGDRRATPALIESLNDRAIVVPVVGALARIGDGRAFERLLTLLGDEDAAIRQAAIAALNSIGHPDMPARIAALLDVPDPLIRESAVRIAGYFAYAECLERVLALRRDEREAVRRAAVESLALFDDVRTVVALMEALQHDTPAVRAAAAAALARTDDPDVADALTAALQDVDPWVRFFALRSLGVKGAPPAAEAVIRTLHHDPAAHVRLAAIDVIGRLGLTDAARMLEPLTRSADRDISVAAIRALSHVDSPETLPILEGFLRDSEPCLRLAAVDGLLNRSDGRVLELLQWIAAADGDPSVSEGAVDALARMASRQRLAPEATKALVALTGHTTTRAASIRALSRLPPRRVPDIATGLEHIAPTVRRGTIEALSRMKQPAASRALEAALDDPDRTVRLTAVIEIKHLGTRTSQPKMMNIARSDPDAGVRHAALLAVARSDADASDAFGPG